MKLNLLTLSFSKLTIKTPERRQWRRFGVFILNFDYIPYLFSSVSIADSEQVIIYDKITWHSCVHECFANEMKEILHESSENPPEINDIVPYFAIIAPPCNTYPTL